MLTADMLWLFELVAAWVPLHEEKPAAAALLLRRGKPVKRAKRDGKAVERPLLPGLDFGED